MVIYCSLHLFVSSCDKFHCDRRKKRIAFLVRFDFLTSDLQLGAVHWGENGPDIFRFFQIIKSFIKTILCTLFEGNCPCDGVLVMVWTVRTVAVSNRYTTQLDCSDTLSHYTDFLNNLTILLTMFCSVDTTISTMMERRRLAAVACFILLITVLSLETEKKSVDVTEVTSVDWRTVVTILVQHSSGVHQCSSVSSGLSLCLSGSHQSLRSNTN